MNGVPKAGVVPKHVAQARFEVEHHPVVAFGKRDLEHGLHDLFQELYRQIRMGVWTPRDAEDNTEAEDQRNVMKMARHHRQW